MIRSTSTSLASDNQTGSAQDTQAKQGDRGRLGDGDDPPDPVERIGRVVNHTAQGVLDVVGEGLLVRDSDAGEVDPILDPVAVPVIAIIVTEQKVDRGQADGVVGLTVTPTDELAVLNDYGAVVEDQADDPVAVGQVRVPLDGEAGDLGEAAGIAVGSVFGTRDSVMLTEITKIRPRLDKVMVHEEACGPISRR